MSQEPVRSQRASRGLPGSVVIGVWCATALLAVAILAPLLARRIEGIDPAYLDWTPGLAVLAAVLVSVGTSLLWAHRLPPRAGATDAVARRRFLLGASAVAGGLLGVVGAVVARISPWLTVTVAHIVKPEVVETHPRPSPQWQGARIRSYRRLGRTRFDVSDVSLGSGQIAGSANGEAIAREAVERGVNYFDTSPDYADAGSERILGRVIKGHRHRMFLATKFCTPRGHLPAGTSVVDYMRALEQSLVRLQTDYVDLVHIHSCDTLDRLMDPNVHEAFDRLKEQGKARYLGFSSHTPNLVEVADTATRSGRFDVMMLAYHHGAWPELGAVIARAKAADIGVVAMKTLKGAKHRGLEALRGEVQAYSQAAFKWVLSNPDVSCLVVSFYDPRHVDEYLHASGQQLSDADLALLDRYDQAIAGAHCRPHCGECLGACPAGVPIDDVLRHRMYFEDYGREKSAMQQYARLVRDAEACLGCPAPCAGACPDGIAIQQATTEAHRLLTLA